jgi:hypothetical protein
VGTASLERKKEGDAQQFLVVRLNSIIYFKLTRIRDMPILAIWLTRPYGLVTQVIGLKTQEFHDG